MAHFAELNENNIVNDIQCDSRYFHNYIPHVQILCEKTSVVSDLIEEPVLPTYCYTREYITGKELKVHKDRQACEISLTVNLDCDIPWDIWIATPSGEERCVTLRPGDAMIYLGCAATHWREEFEGNFCSQVFLHYVRSRGPYSNVYFDKKQTLYGD